MNQKQVKQGLSVQIIANTIKNLPVFLILLIVLVLSIYTILELKKIQPKPTETIESLQTILANHKELEKYKAEYPRITYITKDMLQIAKNNNATFFDNAKEGNYLLEYTTAILTYNPAEDKIINLQEIELAPRDLLDKLTNHTELTAYKDSIPNIVKITKDNLETLKQQLIGLNETFIGNYILTYNDLLTIYDYSQDQIISLMPLTRQPQLTQAQQPQLPTDFFTKLLAHPELKGYEMESPSGFQLDQARLDNFKNTYPNLYKNAALGDYVLRYSNKLIIYDYQNDQIKDIFAVQ